MRNDFNTQKKRAAVRSPLDRYFYYGRYTRVQALVANYAAESKRILDLGCGFGKNTRFIRQQLRREAVGLDLDDLKLQEAKRHPTAKDGWVCGDAVHPPFHAAVFDCILMTEVLEHLIDPPKGLNTCHQLLTDGGKLILTVPSHHNLNYTCNPLLIIEKLLSLFSERLLPRYHHLHAQFEFNWRKPEPEYGMHYHFTWQALEALLKKYGFRLIWKGSYEVEVFPYLLAEWLFQGDLDQITKWVSPIERLMTKTPVVRFLGQHLLVVAEKMPTQQN